MRPLEKLNFVVSTYGRLFVALFKVRLWPPFIFYTLLMGLIIYAIVNMFSSLFSSWIIPLAIWRTGESILHFPEHIVSLPKLFEDFHIPISLFIESLLMASAILMFTSYYRGEKIKFGSSISKPSKSYLKILLVWGVEYLVVIALFEFLPGLFRDFVVGSPRRIFALSVGMTFLSALMAALLAYVLPYVLIHNRKLGESFIGSFNLFFKNFFTTYFFMILPRLPVIAIIWGLQSSRDIVAGSSTTALILLVVLYAISLTLVSFFTSGSIVRYFLRITEE